MNDPDGQYRATTSEIDSPTMRFLFLTNFYPPAGFGGYEMWCREVAEGLRRTGHEVVVLTSSHLQDALSKPDPIWVRRQFNLEMELSSLKNGLKFFIHRKKRESKNIELLSRLVEECDPQIILIWGMWNLPRSLPAAAEKLMPGRVVYYMGDYWPTLPGQFELYWQAPARNILSGFPKIILKQAARRILAKEQQPHLQMERVIFPTTFLRDEFIRKGIVLKKTEIIYGGVHVDAFPHKNTSVWAGRKSQISLLCAGRLAPEKGVHTAIESVSELVHQHNLHMFQLIIAGSGDAGYETFLRELARKNRVDPMVFFLGPQPAEIMPSIYGNADIFLFTSIWPEPFGRVLVEAMATGTPVVGTATGGAAEILFDNENALLFTPGDASSLTKQLLRLVEFPELMRRLSEAGRRTAVSRFSLQRMTSEIEAYLRDTLESFHSTQYVGGRDN